MLVRSRAYRQSGLNKQIIAALAKHGIKQSQMRDRIQSIRVHSDRIIVTLAVSDHREDASRDSRMASNNNRSSSESSGQHPRIRSDDHDARPIDDLPFRESRAIIIPWTTTSRLRKREIIPRRRPRHQCQQADAQ